MHRSIVWLSSVALCAAAPSRPWLSPTEPIASRVASLLSAMTLEEKAMQMNYECDSTLFNWTQTSWASTSIGSVGIECSTPPKDCDVACRIAALRAYQEGALAQSRLGIPVTFVIETSHCGAAGGTIFPMGATMGASWDADLVGAVFSAIAAEARAWGGDRGLSPEINVVTDPRFGRTEENFSEEPLVVARMASAATVGLQGVGQPSEYLPSFTDKIVAEAKHCCAYGFSGLDGGAADISEKSLHDIYFKPWRSAVRSGLRGYMASHNELNGLPMHANGDVHMTLFRGEWNYSGFVHSDWGNIRFLSNTHLCANDTACGSLAVAAGVDQAFVDSPFYPGNIAAGIADGSIKLADVDRAAGNILAAKFAAGLFDGALPDPANRPVIYSDTNRALARRAATESTVLLSNKNNALPLTLTAGAKVAIIGPNSGCAPPAAGASSGTCSLTPTTDCPNNDIESVDGVPDAATCCALCANSTQCVIAVFATDQNICLLKTACMSPSPNPARTICDPGKAKPTPTPWTCDAMRGMLGGYSNLEQQTDALLDNHAHVVTVLEAALSAANASGGAFSVAWAEGVKQSGFDTSGIAAAAALTAESDVAIVVLGDGGESVGYDSSVSCGEGADRPSLDLPGVQLSLLSAIIATGKPTIVVLTHGRPVTFGEDYGGSAVSSFASPDGALNDRAAAVLAAWRPGCEGGGAIWDLLTGIASPSGRLAQSWPRSVGAVRIGGISPGYIKFSDQGGAGWTLGAPFTPLYPLGFGLDYLSVSFGASSAVWDSAASVALVNVTLVNAALRAGKFVVQVYFTQTLSRYTRYQSILGGFGKFDVPASGSISVSLNVSAADMAYYDPKQGTMVLEAGEYTLRVCRDISNCPAANSHTIVVPQSITGL